MDYITTFSFRSPQEKTELAPSGAPAKIEPLAEDNVANAFFRTPPFFSHQAGALVSSAATPQPIVDEFSELLERARRANR